MIIISIGARWGQAGLRPASTGCPGRGIRLLSLLSACLALQIKTKPVAIDSDIAKVPEAPSTPPPLAHKVGTVHQQAL